MNNNIPSLKNVVGKETFRKINHIKTEMNKIYSLTQISNKTQLEVLTIFNNSTKNKKEKEEFMKKSAELIEKHYKLIEEWNTLNNKLLLLLPKRHIIIQNPDGTTSIGDRSDTRYRGGRNIKINNN